MRRILLEYIAAWIEEAHVYAVDLVTNDTRSGTEWYRESGAEAVGAWLDSL